MSTLSPTPHLTFICRNAIGAAVICHLDEKERPDVDISRCDRVHRHLLLAARAPLNHFATQTESACGILKLVEAVLL